MKTKNNLLTGIIIGICLIVLPLILMGTTYTTVDNEVGRYQVSTNLDNTKLKDFIVETIIDTKTGDVISRKKVFVSEFQK